MNPYAVAAMLIGTAAIQVIVAPHVAVAGVRPNLPLVVVTAWGLLRGSGEGIWWGLGAGLLTDLFAGTPLGVFAAGLTLSGMVAGMGERQVFRTHILMPALMVAANTLLAGMMAVGVMKLLDWPVRFGAMMTASVLPEVLYNIVVMVLLFPLLSRLSRRTESETVGL